MRLPARHHAAWLLAWLALVLAGSVLFVRLDIAQRREAFQAQARRAHAALSQRTAGHDAILATLGLLGPMLDRGERPEQRLPAVYPQVLAVLRRDRDGRWSDAALDPDLRAAEARSRARGRAVLTEAPLTAGHYLLVQAGDPGSFALRIDLARLLPAAQWPWPTPGPVRATLSLPGSSWPLHPGQPQALLPAGLTAGFVFEQPLATPSQPFVLRLQQATGPAEWPWWRLAGWAAACALLLGGAAARAEVRRERRRTRELQRIAQVTRLNSLGELAGGVAHELNQPLAAVLANAQAAQRLLREEPPELDTAAQALAGAVAQARRAADVLGRLRRLVQQPDAPLAPQHVSLTSAARQVIELLEPVTRPRGVRVSLEGEAAAVAADPVALEQIIHNLVHNALEALDAVPPAERALRLRVTAGPQDATLTVSDTGPGIDPAALPHVFEPFFSSKDAGSDSGLGLGLSLCERLAQAMHGELSAHAAAPRGAEFRLRLPLATPAAAAGPAGLP